jgi:mycothiol synthase
MSDEVVAATEQLDPATKVLIEAASEQYGAELGRSVLSDEGRRALRGERRAWHLLRRHGDGSLAYAQLRDLSEFLELEVLADRLDGLILESVRRIARQAGLPLHCWLHGLDTIDRAPAEGFELRRALRRLERSLPAPAPGPPPDGVMLRPFSPASDEEAFLDINAASFADHPDQGALDLAALRSREAEDWFDPNCFLLAEQEGRLLGFCWDKFHDEPRGRAGEIYVIGVAPEAVGRGLGRLLLRAGLALMSDRGVDRAFLYVEDDNEAALRLYESEGFHLVWFDALFEVALEN